MDSSLSSLHCRLQERVSIAGKDQNDSHLHAVDARRVGKHTTLNKILLRARIDDSSQGLLYELRI